jgi:uncharacterized protein YcgL (UPF0745 family)
MSSEIVWEEEKKTTFEVMSLEDLKRAIGDPQLRIACMKSGRAELRLQYLNTVMRWYELQQGHHIQTVEFEEDINFLDAKE